MNAKTDDPGTLIAGRLVSLGLVEHRHVSLIHRWNNDFSTTRTLARSRPWTYEPMEAAFDAAMAASDEVHFMVYERHSGRPIGALYLVSIDWRDRTAEFGIVIGEPSARGRGCGTEATRLALAYAFRPSGCIR
jgi:RimJ/RimL family protein N-acetyltransferase